MLIKFSPPSPSEREEELAKLCLLHDELAGERYDQSII